MIPHHPPSPPIHKTGNAECQGTDPNANTFYQNWLTTYGGAIASDVCGNVTWSDNADIQDWTQGCTQSIDVTFTAKDDCGNETSRTATFTITDTEAPVLVDDAVSCSSLNMSGLNQCKDDAALFDPETLIDQVKALYTDVCGSEITVTLESSGPNGENTDCNWSFKYIYRIQDACGNFTFCNVIYSGGDATPPYLDEPLEDCATLNETDVNECLSVATSFDPNDLLFDVGSLYTDNCDANLTVAWLETIEGVENSDCSWSFTYRFTITDNCQLSTICEVVRSGGDSEHPMLMDPDETCSSLDDDDINACLADAENLGGASLEGAIKLLYQDNCDPNFTVEYTGKTSGPLNDDCAWTFTYDYLIKDGCGNSTTCSVTFSGGDLEAPTFTVPDDITLACHLDYTDLNNTGEVTDEADNCTQDLEATFDDDLSSLIGCNGTGAITRTWTLVDDCGLTTVQTQLITIIDEDPPTLILPPDVIVDCLADTDPSGQGTAIYSDNCTPNDQITFGYTDSSTQSTDPNTCGYYNYTIMRTWAAVDLCGNGVSDIQTITVVDDEGPDFDQDPLPADVTVDCSNIPDPEVLTATDICSAASVAFVETDNFDGSCYTFDITRTWTATDVCGNETVHTQIVSVVDNTPPVFDPAYLNLEVECGDDTDPATTGYPAITDDCSGGTGTYDENNCFGNFNSADINAGNGRYFYFDVSGFDGVPASDINEIQLEFETNQGKGHAQFILVAPSGDAVILVGPYCQDPGTGCVDPDPNTKENYNPIFYSCAEGNPVWDNHDVIPQSPNSGDFTPHGGTNSSSNPQPINGLTGSYVDCFEDLSGDMNGTWFIYSVKEANFNGSVKFHGVCLQPNTCVPDGLIVRDWTIEDACGNSADVQQVITIMDNTPPVPDLEPADIMSGCDIPVGQDLTATDDCFGTITASPVDLILPGGSSTIYTIERSWTFIDGCGNEAVTTQLIDVTCCVNIEAYVYLEGSIIEPDGSVVYSLPMRTDLNDLRILPGQVYNDFFAGTFYSPPGQPYNVAPWNYLGTEGDNFDSGGNLAFDDAGYPATVTDWVLVSLRETPDDIGTPICQAAALLHNDGTIEFVDDFECCDVDLLKEYYVVVEHRNHLIVMSHEAVGIVDHNITYDFRSQESYIFDDGGFGAQVGQKEILLGVYAMYGGNGNQIQTPQSDTDINFDDRTFWEGENSIIGIYSTGDYNLNGDVNFNDRILFEFNNTLFTSVPRD